MKTLILKLNILIILILLTACEENFSPKSDFSEKYILYCVLNVDSSKQTAVLLKSYDVSGFDPYVNEYSPFVSGADIKIRQKDNVYFMRDTSAIFESVSRYNDPISFYHVENFQSIGNDSIEIVATLPTGKKLYSISKAPENIVFDRSNSSILPPEEADLFTFSWSNLGTNIWYLPKLEFYYIKDGITKTKLVPVTYQMVNGESEPVYPTTTNRNFVNFTTAALNMAFAEISADDPAKSSYKILGAKLSVLVFNEPLSNYYSTTNGFLDDFTIVLDETDYTNVSGGFGVFGILKQQQTGAKFTEEFIQSFGYTVGLN